MPLRDFIVSPGFAGAAAVVAALIVLCAVLYAAGGRVKGSIRSSSSVSAIYKRSAMRSSTRWRLNSAGRRSNGW